MCPTFILGRGLANAAVAAGCAPGAVLVFGTFAAILGEDESDRGIVRFARIGTDRWTGSDEHWDPVVDQSDGLKISKIPFKQLVSNFPDTATVCTTLACIALQAR